MMKNLKTYRMFESSVALTPEQVEWLDQCTRGTWELNPQTGLVDVDGDLHCYYQGLSDFKGVRFGKVGKDFYCHSNQLTTLEGAPREVGGDFYCDDNQLTSLEGAPQKVGGDFYCDDNQLTSLEGAPQKVGGDFVCDDNQLTTLEGAPREVGGDFSCDKNQLASLEGAPQKVGGNFYCSYNQLTTLEGAPREVGGNFVCGYNQLATLEGAPQKVGGSFYCRNNTVSEETLESIFRLMKKGESYLKAVESLWTKISVEDQTLLYRPEFEWVVGDERRKLDALRAYQGFKGMI